VVSHKLSGDGQNQAFEIRPGRLPGVRKIAVLRASAMGDFIFSLPALEALRGAYPEAEIVLLARRWHAEFLEGRPGSIDRVVVVPSITGVNDDPGANQDPSALERFLRAMRREHFDVAIQLHGGGRYSNPFVLHLGAKVTVGMRTEDAPLLDRWIPYIYYQPEILRTLEVVGLVGGRTENLEPRLAVTERDLQESLAAVPQTQKPLAALHPGAGDPRRRWPPEKFAEVGNALAAASALVVVTGTRPERHLVEAVRANMSGAAEDLCDRLSLGGLAGLFSRCRVVVSNDSGPLHLAAASGAATAGIYWCGNLINAEPITRARHRAALSWQLACSLCGANCTVDRCDHLVSYVTGVPVAEVRDPALELLATQAYRPAVETAAT
jgi:ADP-heptose:LPS heptosyltransferase